jgi:hypothetical protein
MLLFCIQEKLYGKVADSEMVEEHVNQVLLEADDTYVSFVMVSMLIILATLVELGDFFCSLIIELQLSIIE